MAEQFADFPFSAGPVAVPQSVTPFGVGRSMPMNPQEQAMREMTYDYQTGIPTRDGTIRRVTAPAPPAVHQPQPTAAVAQQPNQPAQTSGGIFGGQYGQIFFWALVACAAIVVGWMVYRIWFSAPAAAAAVSAGIGAMPSWSAQPPQPPAQPLPPAQQPQPPPQYHAPQYLPPQPQPQQQPPVPQYWDWQRQPAQPPSPWAGGPAQTAAEPQPQRRRMPPAIPAVGEMSRNPFA